MDDPPEERTARDKAEPFHAGDPLEKKSLNFAGAAVEATTQWLRQARQEHKRPALSWLVDAALADLPTDPQGLQALAEAVPAEILETGPTQIGIRIRRDTVRRVEDAYFELTATRTRDVILWHALTGALLNQLEAEGIPVPQP